MINIILLLSSFSLDNSSLLAYTWTCHWTSCTWTWASRTMTSCTWASRTIWALVQCRSYHISYHIRLTGVGVCLAELIPWIYLSTSYKCSITTAKIYKYITCFTILWMYTYNSKIILSSTLFITGDTTNMAFTCRLIEYTYTIQLFRHHMLKVCTTFNTPITCL